MPDRFEQKKWILSILCGILIFCQYYVEYSYFVNITWNTHILSILRGILIKIVQLDHTMLKQLFISFFPSSNYEIYWKMNNNSNYVRQGFKQLYRAADITVHLFSTAFCEIQTFKEIKVKDLGQTTIHSFIHVHFKSELIIHYVPY